MHIGLILLALAFPLLELAVLIKVGQFLGFWWTLLLLIAMAAAGGAILQRQGISAARRAAQSISDGRPPIEPVVDSLMLMLAGTLLIMPGLITDVMGLLLLVPPIRHEVARWGLSKLIAGANVRMETRQWRSDETAAKPPPGYSRGTPSDGPVIDGEWERVEEPKKDDKPRGDRLP